MAELVMDEYLGMLERSRLFDSKQQLADCLETWRGLDDTYDPEDVTRFSAWLVQNNYITQWQADNIFAGKYKGFLLGQYKLLRSIGAGGMSSVYLAIHEILRRQVAIKVLPKSRVTSDSSYLDRFLLEAQAVAALDHPNIVRAYDIDTEGSSIYYLVMEYIDGPDLLSLVKKNGPLDIYKAASYIRQAATGLQHAHEAGLIHRDMKPANLLVDKDDVIHVLDLGLARFTDEKRSSLTLTYDENVLGTADYLAPEQARNSHAVDCRADIYGLGCTLYYLLVGHVPFPDGTLAQRIAAHQKRMPVPIRDERPEVPQDLADICWRMMAKDPNDRQQSAQEVADDLTYWLLDHGQQVKDFTGSKEALAKKRAENNPVVETVQDSQNTVQNDALRELEAITQLAALGPAPKPASAKATEDPEPRGLFRLRTRLASKSGDSSKSDIEKNTDNSGKSGDSSKTSRSSDVDKKRHSSGSVRPRTVTDSRAPSMDANFLDFVNRSSNQSPKTSEDSSSYDGSSVVNLNLDAGSRSSSATPGTRKNSEGGSSSTRKVKRSDSGSGTSSQYVKKPAKSAKQETRLAIGVCVALLVVLLLVALFFSV